MNDERLMQVLVSPHVSEKATMASMSGRQYVFKVAVDATKREIKGAIEKIFSVSVDSVRTVSVRGKTVTHRHKKGRRKSWKKAYVTLSEGSEISVGAEAA